MNSVISHAAVLAMLCIAAGCTRDAPAGGSVAISNEQIRTYSFLECMANDDYFPANLVDKGRQILRRLSERIETEVPADEAALYRLTHASTNRFNELSEEFYDADSEIETVARECIAADFEFIANAYGFENADPEELIATREW